MITSLTLYSLLLANVKLFNQVTTDADVTAIDNNKSIAAVSVASSDNNNSSPLDKKQLHCLTEVIYFESRGEPIKGQYAVGHTVLNRVNDKRWKNTICGVVYQKKQFSWTQNKPNANVNSKAWHQSKSIAEELYTQHMNKTRNDSQLTKGSVYFRTAKYHPNTKQVTKIGNHYFSK